MMPCSRISSGRVNFSVIKNTWNLNQNKEHQILHPFSQINCSIRNMQAPTQQLSFEFLTKKLYEPPSWASHLNPIPSHIFSLGHVIKSLFLHVFMYLYLYMQSFLIWVFVIFSVSYPNS